MWNLSYETTKNKEKNKWKSVFTDNFQCDKYSKCPPFEQITFWSLEWKFEIVSCKYLFQIPSSFQLLPSSNVYRLRSIYRVFRSPHKNSYGLRSRKYGGQSIPLLIFLVKSNPMFLSWKCSIKRSKLRQVRWGIAPPSINQ